MWETSFRQTTNGNPLSSHISIEHHTMQAVTDFNSLLDYDAAI